MQTLNILLLNKSDAGGGAAIACRRLLESLQKNSVHATMLVQQKTTSNAHILSTTHTRVKEFYNLLLFLAERAWFLLYEKSADVRFAFSLANTGETISKDLIEETDILHLHWINQGFISFNGLHTLFSSNKPIMWTLHDMWPFTGGCHYVGSCTKYRTECNFCPFLRWPSSSDLSQKIFHKKKRLYSSLNPLRTVFVTCSRWLETIARRSALLQHFQITTIPNPIDTSLYHPVEKATARCTLGLPLDKKLILFGAGNIYDPRKGLQHLIKALNILRRELGDNASALEVIFFGKAKHPLNHTIPFKSYSLGVISDEATLINLYNSCDVFVLPSTEDNLPNTVMESLACGTPVVAFNIGGLPELIDHMENGYLAQPFSPEDLAHGLKVLLTTPSYGTFSHRARQKVITTFSMDVVAKQYLTLYEHLCTAL
ncbi:MAG: glycosyltransferase family 4 protein [Bacteroidetes bacterium]|nr:glycosyltransferase family 4 protein [Bacteroidota bacterium]